MYIKGLFCTYSLFEYIRVSKQIMPEILIVNWYQFIVAYWNNNENIEKVISLIYKAYKKCLIEKKIYLVFGKKICFTSDSVIQDALSTKSNNKNTLENIDYNDHDKT